MKALWNGKVLAESTETIIIEGNHYFPPASVKMEYFEKSNTVTSCFWKGLASYYSIKTDDATNEDAAWYYPEPTDAAAQLKNYVAFWKGVEITE